MFRFCDLRSVSNRIRDSVAERFEQMLATSATYRKSCCYQRPSGGISDIDYDRVVLASRLFTISIAAPASVSKIGPVSDIHRDWHVICLCLLALQEDVLVVSQLNYHFFPGKIR